MAGTQVEEGFFLSQASAGKCELPPSAADADLAAVDLPRIAEWLRLAQKRRAAVPWRVPIE
eukprot:2536779-Pyramimonas_sp.AAC.1